MYGPWPTSPASPCCIAPRAIGPSIYDRVIALFRGEGISPRIVQEVTPMTTLVGLVAAGTGIGFVTAGIARAARPGVAYRPVFRSRRPCRSPPHGGGKSCQSRARVSWTSSPNLQKRRRND